MRTTRPPALAALPPTQEGGAPAAESDSQAILSFAEWYRANRINLARQFHAFADAIDAGTSGEPRQEEPARDPVIVRPAGWLSGSSQDFCGSGYDPTAHLMLDDWTLDRLFEVECVEYEIPLWDSTFGAMMKKRKGKGNGGKKMGC